MRYFLLGITSMDDFVTPFAPFKYGREDCDIAPYTSNEYEFPEPHMTYDEVMLYFEATFNFNANQTAAIMGAHTLGNCELENSGYRGPWLDDPSIPMKATFDNSYYAFMINSSFTYTGKVIF